VDKVILQVTVTIFRALSKNFSGKDGSAPLEKIGPYAYDFSRSRNFGDVKYGGIII